LETKPLAPTPQRSRSFGAARPDPQSLKKKAFQHTGQRKKLLLWRAHVLFSAPKHMRDCSTARSQSLNIEE